MTRAFSDLDAQITRRIGVADLHNDLALCVMQERNEGRYDSLSSYWLPRLMTGGVSIVVCAICIPTPDLPEGALRLAVRMVDGLLVEIDQNSDHIAVAVSAADIRKAIASGGIAAVLAFEGAEPLGQDLSALRVFHRLGIRMISLTWMRRTAFGDGTWENDSGGGLTRIGRAAVRAMNELGVIVDISHASDRTAWDILEISDKPVVASHSNARAVCDHPRNLTDDMIRAVAAGGGVVGVNSLPPFVDAASPTIARWVDHLEHIVSLVGIEHVAVGADFTTRLSELRAWPGVAELSPSGRASSSWSALPGLAGPDDFPALTAELLRRGLVEAQIRRVFQENFLRVLEAVVGA